MSSQILFVTGVLGRWYSLNSASTSFCIFGFKTAKTSQTTKFAISAASGLEADGFLVVWTGRSHRGTPLAPVKTDSLPGPYKDL